MRPKVSVIMPVLNGQKYIGEAIESILAQTYPFYELVLVDDGSTDSTIEKVRQYESKMEIRYVSHSTPRGIPRSMNDGIRASSGDFIAFLDHDDAWMPEFLETQVSYLDSHPDVGMVHSDFQTIDPNGNILEASIARYRNKIRPSGSVFGPLFQDSFIVGNSVLIRRGCFEELGLFDESLRWGDYLMWMRISRHYRVDYVDDVLTKYRQHPSQSTRTITNERADDDSVGLQTIKKILELYPETRTELGEKVVSRRFATLYFDKAYTWWSRGMYGHARICMQRALRHWPTNPHYWAVYAGTFLGASLVAKLLQIRRSLRRLLGPAGTLTSTSKSANHHA
jgi:glycosyltransferase involved in cell wall biosynthesis